MLTILKQLFGTAETGAERDAFRRAISIDVSGPEFRDLYPTQADIAGRLQSASIWHDDAVPWMAQAAQASIAAGAGLRENVRAVVATGRLLAKDELKALGLHHSRKVGADFVAAVHDVEACVAIDLLEAILHTAASHASHMHNLRRWQEAGITHCRLASPQDERETAIERKFNRRKLTLKEARRLAIEHQAEIRRSAFTAIVEF